jgi:hypothetical protein
MPKFFLKLLNNKNLLFFALLFVLVFAIPQIAFAAWYNPFSWGADFGVAIVNGLIACAFAIPLFIIMTASSIANILFQLVLAYVTTVKVTQDPAVNIGWPIVRDLANMMIVLGFVVIGIATALRIREYEAKQLLVKLIIVALLINFSLLICGIFIDGTNILMNFFFSNVTLCAPGVATPCASSFVPGLTTLGTLFGNIASTDPINFGAALLGMAFFQFIAFFIYILYAIMLLARIIALWMLVILSPLAFVCYVFPATRSVWQMWWKNFFQWCIIGIPAGLFYYIGFKMIANNAASPAPIDISTLLTSTGLANYISGAISTILVPGLFLIVGFFVSLQFSAMGAGAIMGFANKNKGKILGGGFSALQKASGKAGSALQDSKFGKMASSLQSSTSTNAPLRWASKTAGFVMGAPGKTAGALGNYAATQQKTRSALGRLGEQAGAIPTGIDAARTQKTIDTGATIAKAALNSGDTKQIATIENDAANGTGQKKASALQALTDLKRLHTVKGFQDANGSVDMNKLNNAFVASEGFGMSKEIRNKAQNAMPSFARVNPAGIEKFGADEKAKLQKANPTWSTARTDAAFNRTWSPTQIGDALEKKQNAGMKMADMRDIPSSQMDANHIIQSNTGTWRRAAVEYTTEQKDRAVELKNERSENSMTDQRNVAMGAIGPDHAARQIDYDTRLSTQALTNEHNNLSRGALNTWSAGLAPEQRAAYTGAANTAERTKVYRDIERQKRAAASPQGDFAKGDDINGKMSAIDTLKK